MTSQFRTDHTPRNVYRPLVRPHVPPRPLKQRYAERVTIGIGLLATDEAFKPDTLIMTCDTKGSYGDTHSTDEFHKMYRFPDERLYMVAADDLNKACEFVPMIQTNLRKVERREHGAIYHALHEAAGAYHQARANYELSPRFQLTSQFVSSEVVTPARRARSSI